MWDYFFFFFLISKRDEYNQDEYKKDVGLTYQKKKKKERKMWDYFYLSLWTSGTPVSRGVTLSVLQLNWLTVCDSLHSLVSTFRKREFCLLVQFF